MAISALTLPAFSPFSLDEYSAISASWRKYKKRFENLVLALNAKGEERFTVKLPW